MAKDRNELIELFQKNYSAKDLINMLLDRMSQEEIDQELKSFEEISNDPENSEHPVQ